MTKLKRICAYLSEEDLLQLKDKAHRTGIPYSALVRTLIRGYRPKEQPDERFYAAMRGMEGIADGIRRLADGVRSTGGVDAQKLDEEMERWHRFQAEIERYFLRPEDDSRRWR